MDGPLIVYKDIYDAEKDVEVGKVTKKRRLNSTGENVFLHPDGSVAREEDKIIAAQRIWRHEYYKPDGKGFLKAFESFSLNR
jgi:hypothetical protein